MNANKKVSPEPALAYMNPDEKKAKETYIAEMHGLKQFGELFEQKTSAIFKAQLPKSNVLDIGTGNGRIFNIFKDIGIDHTHGADFGDYLSIGRPTDSFKTFDFSADRFPYDDAAFDGITSVEVIEHLENPYHFLREMARILKPGGILILTTPNPDHIWNKISFFKSGKFYRFLDGNDHIMLFAHYVLSKGALKYFDLIKTEYLFGQFPYRFLNRFKFPENKFFGRTAFYILRKKSET